MNPFPTLRSWLGRPPVAARKKTPARRPPSALGCERLEDRLNLNKTFASLPTDPPPATGTELVAQVRSANPFQDLANVVSFLGLGSGVDLARSSVAFATPTNAILSVALRSPSAASSVTDALMSAGIFDFVSPNYVYDTGVPVSPDLRELRERVPNDPLFPNQTHHPIIQSPAAWDRSFGDPGVIVAVIDDGVDTNHPDLKDNLWSNPREIAGDGIDNDGNGFTDDVNGWDFVNNRNTVTPDTAADTHGTQVTGLLAGRIDNAAGIAGIAGRSMFMPLKVVGNGPTTSLALARAVGYAVQNGARIINNSLNIDPFVNDPVFKMAVSFAYDRGLLWVNSAGNLNLANPARQAFEEILIVAATDGNDVKTPYSNYGSGIDLAAPGGLPDNGLLTTVGGGFGPAFGTSMAAALVSGTAALVWSAFPNYTRDQVASALTGTADSLDLKNPAFLDLLGAGRVNTGKAGTGTPFVTKLGRLKGLPEQGQPAPASLPGFTLRLVSTLDPASTGGPNFELRWAGPDNQFNTPDDTLLPLSVNDGRAYKIGTNQFEFTVGAELNRGLYRFTARSGGLADPFGRPVDGDGDGQAGGDLVREFGIAYQVSGTVYEDIQDDGSEDDTDPGSPGHTVFADLNGNGLMDRFSFVSSHPAVSIPDFNSTGVTSTVSVSGIVDPVCDVTVTVFLSHPYLSDLTIILEAPNGERIVLLRNRQLVKFVPDSTLITFRDDIEEEASDATPTLAMYRLRPEDRLDRLRGTNANGTWRVIVTDGTAADTGGLIRTTIDVATEPCTTTDENGNFALVGLPLSQVELLVSPRPGFIPSSGGNAIVVNPLPMVGVPSQVAIGLVRQGAIYGRVLRDNGDGTAGPGDAGQSGLTVFVDRNGNGVRDAADPAAVTDADGNYVIAGLMPGQYTIRFIDQPGYVRLSPAVRTAVLLGSDAVDAGNDFLVRRETAPVQLAIPPFGPLLRTEPVESIPITLSEPIPDFRLSDLMLFRDDRVVPLSGATLIGSGLSYTLVGLSMLTAADGVYRLTVAAPAPPDEPDRRPAPVQIQWTTDMTGPSATLSTITSIGVTGVRAVFSEPVSGVTTAAFVLKRNGIELPLVGVTVVGSGSEYRLENLGPLTRNPGEYTLELITSAVRDAAGNEVRDGAAVTFRVDQAVPLPPPPRPGQRTIVGPGEGGTPVVNVYDTPTASLLFSVVAFEASFSGGVRVAAGDVNGDGIEDVVVAPGPGGGPRIRVFDGRDGRELVSVMAFEEGFVGGLFVATGDLDGDGAAEIIVSPDLGGGPRIRVFAGRTLTPGADFFGIADPAFRGGARAAIGDVNGDGRPDLLVSAGFGGGPRVAGFDGRSVVAGGTPVRVFNDFFVFEETLRNGAFLAAGDVDGDGFADVIAGGGPTGGPRVFVLSGKDLVGAGLLTPVANFFAGDPAGRGGVRVAVKDMDGDGRADVMAADGDGRSTVRSYNGASLVDNPEPPFSEFAAFEGFTGGVFVG